MTPTGESHYSGVLVLTHPDQLDRCAGVVGAIQGVDIYLRDEKAGRLIAVLESEDAGSQESLLSSIRSAEGVLSAALVYHYVDSEAAGRNS